MAEVADAASLSRSSAYRYFPSVEALIAEVALDATVAPDIEGIDTVAVLDGTAEERLTAVVRADHEVVIRHDAAFRAAIRTMLADEAAHDRMPRVGPATGSATSRPPSPRSTNGCSRPSANDWSPHWR